MPPKLRYSIFPSFASSAIALSTRCLSCPTALATSLFLAWLTVARYLRMLSLRSSLILPPSFSPFELGLRPPSFPRVCKVINMLLRKRDPSQLEKLFPAYPLNPLSHSLIFLGIFSIDPDDLLDDVHHFRPAGRVVREGGNDQTGKHGRFSGIGHFASRINGHTVPFSVGKRHSRTDGKTVSAVHAEI